MWSETKKKMPMSWLFFVVKNFFPPSLEVIRLRHFPVHSPFFLKTLWKSDDLQRGTPMNAAWELQNQFTGSTDPGLERRSQHCGWARAWRGQAERAWAPACLCGRDCASRHCCLVFCAGPWRMERSSLKHTGLLSSSPSPYAPADPVRLEINPGEPPYRVFGPLCVVLATLRWLG